MDINITLPDTLNFTLGGKDMPVQVADLNEAALVGLLTYGMRKANDTFNSAKGGESPLSAEQVIEKIKVWDFGKGGSKVSPLMKALREIVATHLKSVGVKAGDAVKEAKDPGAGFRVYLNMALAAKMECGMTEVGHDELERAFDANWTKVEAKAAELVAMQSVDITI